MMIRKKRLERIEEVAESEKIGMEVTKLCEMKKKKLADTADTNTDIDTDTAPWSELDVDMLREIARKLSDYADHIRFRGVCKTWRAAGLDVKRAGDVLPWLMTFSIDGNVNNLMNYKLFEQPDPFQSDGTGSIIYGAIKVKDAYSRKVVTRVCCVDGWLHIYLLNLVDTSCSFLLYSLATKESFALPQLNHYTRLATSTAPDSPDCVFVALSLFDGYTKAMIRIFRHGDTHWTTQFVGDWFGMIFDGVVHIHGVFYFLLTQGIGSYDLATGLLKVDPYSTKLKFHVVHHFFGLDGDLMLAYLEDETRKYCISRYDWSDRVWVPVQSMGTGRSLYITESSVCVDQRDYYGILAANMIYANIRGNYCVDEYVLENGQLAKCPSPRLTRWGDSGSYTSRAIWAEPPGVLLRK